MSDQSRQRQYPSGFYAPGASASSYGSIPPPPPPGGVYQQQQPVLYNYSNAPQAPVYPNYGNQMYFTSLQQSRKRPRPAEYKCEPCNLTLESESALKSHQASHIKCSSCCFEAAPKVVKGHYQSAHGKYSGRGFKTITIAVPGCPVQRFRICVGNRPEDLQKWIAERKKRFPRSQQPKAEETKKEVQKEEKGLSSLLDGYGSSSSEDENDKKKDAPAEKSGNRREEEETTADPKEVTGLAAKKLKPCHAFMRHGKCRNGDNCHYSHDIPVQKQQQHQHGRKKARTNLLGNLLTNDIRRERTLTLQLLEYIADTDFLSKPRPKSDE